MKQKENWKIVKYTHWSGEICYLVTPTRWNAIDNTCFDKEVINCPESIVKHIQEIAGEVCSK